jgi:hypothetical protein
MKKRKVIHKNKIKKGKFATTCGNPGKKDDNSRNRLIRKSTSQAYDLIQQNQIFYPP